MTATIVTGGEQERTIVYTVTLNGPGEPVDVPFELRAAMPAAGIYVISGPAASW
jgi:hypothetical protein